MLYRGKRNWKIAFFWLISSLLLFFAILIISNARIGLGTNEFEYSFALLVSFFLIVLSTFLLILISNALMFEMRHK